MAMTDKEREALDIRLDAYLDGLLGSAETRETERMLTDPEVSAALVEALALRDILATSEDEAPPEELSERIIEAVGLEAPPLEPRGATHAARPGRARTAFNGASWLVRQSGGGGRSGSRAALAGAGTVRYALGPIALVGAGGDDEPPPRTAWWRTALRLGRRR
jgi:anti-sigma factor RsiW